MIGAIGLDAGLESAAEVEEKPLRLTELPSPDHSGRHIIVFGPVLHRLTFGEAIERDLLSDYQVVIVGVDDETYRAWAEHGEFVTPDGKRITDARTLAGQIALAKAMRKYDLRRMISFHSRVNAARKTPSVEFGVKR